VLKYRILVENKEQVLNILYYVSSSNESTVKYINLYSGNNIIKHVELIKYFFLIDKRHVVLN